MMEVAAEEESKLVKEVRVEKIKSRQSPKKSRDNHNLFTESILRDSQIQVGLNTEEINGGGGRVSLLGIVLR